MKEIKAYIREDRMAAVVRGLRTRGARAITAVRVVPMGSEVEPEFVDISSSTPVEHYTPMLKLELVCDDEHASAFAETIRDRAHNRQARRRRDFHFRRGARVAHPQWQQE